MFVDDRRPVGDWLSENYIDLSPTSDNHFFLVVFGGRQMIVDDRRPVGDWSAIGCQNSLSARGFRCSIENLSPTKQVGEMFLNIVWSATVLRSIRSIDWSAISRRPVFSGCPSFFLVSNNKTATKE